VTSDSQREPKILVVGGGTMGRGIAGLCAQKGHPTAIYESDERTRASVRETIRGSWLRAVERGKLAPEDAGRSGERLSVIERLEEAADAGIAVEAVPESLELKRRVFAELDRVCARAAALASNTSSLSIEAIASATARPERVLGIHFFNPVAAMPLVEIIRSSRTADSAEQAALQLARSLGKTVVRVRDAPGFATSRLGVALGLEAMRMVEEGIASPEDIDRAMELGYGHRMGPLKTSDLVGLDVRLAIAESLSRELDPERFRVPAVLKRLVARGWTGRKAGRGFYAWDGDVPRPAAPEEESP
jgi:3-hydroxybutyryl-CoA dehydrogenase